MCMIDATAARNGAHLDLFAIPSRVEVGMKDVFALFEHELATKIDARTANGSLKWEGDDHHRRAEAEKGS